MEPKHEFGKDVFKTIQLQKQKEKKMRTIFKIMGVLIALSFVVFLWYDSKASGNKKGDKTEKLSKTKSSKQNKGQVTVSGDISIIKKWDMPSVLVEISGITYMDENRFATVQDEFGKIFIYNTQKNAVEKEIAFGADGDYEGLAMVNSTIWVLRADGMLFEVTDAMADKPIVKQYKTQLTAKHNVEGLCYDQARNRLLLAIKDGEPGGESYKGIYGFDLATKKMQLEPVFKINLDDKIFANLSSKKKKGVEMMPSSIAIHPLTKDIYITDGSNASLLVMNADGTLKKLFGLDKKEFNQPEGITFKPNGDMLISNEGSKQPGNILNVQISE
ncbi:MAG: hypothetical protein ABIP79_11985 [Chitinophagaceae bacterium]